MQCQYVGDGGNQCKSEATRDIKIKAGKLGWRFFLCDNHVEEVSQMVRSYIDRLARQQVEQEQKG